MAFPWRTRARKQNTSNSIGLLVTQICIPDHFRCPISLDLMKDPVTAPTGITYDRQSIERWLYAGNSNCPVTSQSLSIQDLIPNHTVRIMIQNWCAANLSHGIERIPTPQIPVTAAEAAEILSEINLASQRGDGDYCRELAGRIRSLATDSERNRQCFVSNNAASVLAVAFRSFTTGFHDVLVEILSTIVSLLPPIDDEVVWGTLGSQECLNSIKDILKFGDVGSRLNSALMVQRIVSSNENLAKAVAETNGLIEELMNLIKEPVSKKATKASLAASFYLITNNEATVTKFVQIGMIPVLLEILVGSEKSLIENTLVVFDGLCDCEQGRELACRHKLTVPVLVKKMFRVSDMATEFVVSILWKLCKNCEGDCLVECLQVGTFQKLLFLLQVGCGTASKKRATELLKLMRGCNEKLECVDTVDFRGLKRPS